MKGARYPPAGPDRGKHGGARDFVPALAVPLPSSRASAVCSLARFVGEAGPRAAVLAKGRRGRVAAPASPALTAPAGRRAA